MMDKITFEVLQDEGLDSSRKGFYYIADALEFYDPLSKLEYELYPKIAAKYNASPKAVSRAMYNTKQHSKYAKISMKSFLAHLQIILAEHRKNF